MRSTALALALPDLGHVLQSFYQWSNTPVGYISGVLAIITTVIGVRRWLSVRRNPPIVDPIQKRQHAAEDHYLTKLHEMLLRYSWDPKTFVTPTLHSKEGSPRIRPSLLALDHAPAENSDARTKVVSRPVTDLLLEAKTARDLLLLGDPGCGKTVCLLELAMRFTKESLHCTSSTRKIPIFVPLSQYTDSHGPGEPGVVRDLIVAAIRRVDPSNEGADLLERLDVLLRDGRVALLFDAIDEMPRDDYYQRWRRLRDFAENNPGNIFVFSCRVLDAIEDTSERSRTIMISSFSEKQVRSYLRKTGIKGDRFRAMVERDPDLRQQLSSPFFLSLLASTLRTRAEIPTPTTWDNMIRHYVEAVLEAERKRREVPSASAEWAHFVRSLNEFLSRLAFDLVQVKSSGTVADQAALDHALNETNADRKVIDLALAAGLLRQVSEDGDLRFTHHKLQEYFAARRLAEEWNDGHCELPPLVDDIWWQEVLVMAAGLIAEPDEIISSILSLSPPATHGRFNRAELNRTLIAVRMLQTARSKLSVATQERLTARLIAFMHDGDLLQKVRALRIAHLVPSEDLVEQTKARLSDQSRWVRENAMFALANMVSATPKFIRLVWREVFRQQRRADIFESGLFDLIGTATAAHDLRVTLVMLASYAYSLARTVFAGCVFGLPFFLAWHLGFASVAFLIVYLALSMMVYFGIRWYSRIGVSRYLGLVFNNPWRLFLPPFSVTTGVAAAYYGISFIQRYLTGILQIVAAAVVLIAIASILRSMLRQKNPEIESKVKALQEKLEKGEQSALDAQLFDISSSLSQEDRNVRADRWIEMAKSLPFAPQRIQMLRRLVVLYPLTEPVLQSIENFARVEPDILVRECAWQLYDQIDLSLQRGTVRDDLHAEPTKIDAYDVRWPEMFEQDRVAIQQAFDTAVRIEHFGSTAVPGLRARPIIDTLVLVDVLPSETSQRGLRAQGYTRRDTIHPGVLSVFERRSPRGSHVYVAYSESRFAREGRLLRDYLRRSHPDAEEFARLKDRFATGSELVSYDEAKARWLQNAIGKAAQAYVLETVEEMPELASSLAPSTPSTPLGRRDE